MPLRVRSRQSHTHISHALTLGDPVSDEDFDSVYAAPWRELSERHWTPLDVAATAARWLTAQGARAVLDVGSGVGKFCLVGAAVTDAWFVGVEQHFAMTIAARAAATSMALCERVNILHAEVSLPLLRDYGALYLFNPFTESPLATEASVERAQLHDRDVWLVEEALRLMPVGGRVATFHGFGGRIPGSFRLERVESHVSGPLRLWVSAGALSDGWWVETIDDVLFVPTPDRHDDDSRR